MPILPTLNTLKDFFPFIDIRYLRTFLGFLYCIFNQRSVNLNRCKTVFQTGVGDTKLGCQAAYKRLLRFFAMRHACLFCICIGYLIIFTISGDMSQCIYLALDRTNWQLGDENKVNINVLMLGIVLPNGCFVPICWELLDKKGNSNQAERSRLLRFFLKYFGDYLPKQLANKDFILLADREFIGKQWFAELAKHMQFVIRTRKDDYLHAVAQSLDTTIDRLATKIAKRVQRDGFFYATITLDNQTYQYVVLPNKKKNAKDPFVRFITTLTDLKTIAKAYYERWSIEVFFKKCKSDGFQLEDLNFTQPKKIMIMIAVVGYAYTLTLKQGMMEHQKKPIKEQYYAKQNRTYKRKSIFKLGLELIIEQLSSVKKLWKIIKVSLKKDSITDYNILLPKSINNNFT